MEVKHEVLELLDEHVRRVIKQIGYPAVWSKVTEQEMNTAINAIAEEVRNNLSHDGRLDVALAPTQLFSSGKLNGDMIHQALLNAAQVQDGPCRAKMIHLATNAELVLRSARLMKNGKDNGQDTEQSA